MDIIQLKKCGRTANNKLLVQLLKARIKKAQKPVQTSAKCCVLQSAFKKAGRY
jgi:hypothetical protein